MKTLHFKEGQTYICINTNSRWWTVGKEYTVVLDYFNEPLLVDDENDYWSSKDINLYCNQFKLKEEQPNVTPKEGQTYVCKRDTLAWWTLDKEYKVQASSNGLLYLTDDEGDNWYLPNDWLLKTVFKLNEQTFDLNKLTTSQLREYVELLEDKENAERLLNDFIERMSK